MIPAVNSRKWLVVFIIYAAAIFAAFFVTRVLRDNHSLNRSVSGILILSVFTSLVPSIGGYMGKRVFFIIYTISVVLGLLFALYTVLANIAPGWDDLTSIIGYLFIVAIGFIVAANAELIRMFLNNRQ